ncbi:MAG: S41 family peptidase, partial [Sediminibacterium sp.]
MKRAGIIGLFFLTTIHFAFSQKKAPPIIKISAALLKEDFVLLRNILEANHPSLYWYTPKDSMDLYFDQSINSITDSLDEVQFKNKVAWLVSKIRCGHTTVFFSKKYTKNAAQYRYPSFPLYLKAWGDSLVVLANLFPKDSVFKRGTIITGINGRTNRQLLDTLFQFISSDGYAFNYKNQVVSGNFPIWYKTIIGVDSSYNITYIDSTGKEASAIVRNFKPFIDTSLSNRQHLSAERPKQPSRREKRKAALLAKREMRIDTTLNTAFIRLSTFSNGGLAGFFRRSFKTIKQKNIQHLVIDLRENGGGKVVNSILLTKYLSDHLFKVGDSVIATSRKFKYGSYIHPSLIYWFAMNFGAHRAEDGWIHYRRYENHLFKPKEKYHYNGQVILLQGGYSFSATTMFISNIKGQKNITVAGEESGGGYYGNSAMYIPTITLPNSKLRISLPMYRLVMDLTRPKGHGIMPDLEIAPSAESIKKGIDQKMYRIRQMIQQ